jgi:hypothetical protein
MLVTVRRNPLVDSFRKALDQTTLALAINGVLVNEYTHPTGKKGVEYVIGKGTDGKVIATWDNTKPEPVLQYVNQDLTPHQEGLIDAHCAMFAQL